MSRATVVITGPASRQKVIQWASTVPVGTRIDFKEAKRTLAQNDRLWAMLTDVASQKEHASRKYTTDQWKVLFMHACGREVQFIPALDNSTFIPWGQSSSDLSVGEMTELIEFMLSWGAENGVVFHDQHEEAA